MNSHLANWIISEPDNQIMAEAVIQEIDHQLDQGNWDAAKAYVDTYQQVALSERQLTFLAKMSHKLIRYQLYHGDAEYAHVLFDELCAICPTPSGVLSLTETAYMIIIADINHDRIDQGYETWCRDALHKAKGELGWYMLKSGYLLVKTMLETGAESVLIRDILTKMRGLQGDAQGRNFVKRARCLIFQHRTRKFLAFSEP